MKKRQCPLAKPWSHLLLVMRRGTRRCPVPLHCGSGRWSPHMHGSAAAAAGTGARKACYCSRYQCQCWWPPVAARALGRGTVYGVRMQWRQQPRSRSRTPAVICQCRHWYAQAGALLLMPIRLRYVVLADGGGGAMARPQHTLHWHWQQRRMQAASEPPGPLHSRIYSCCCCLLSAHPRRMRAGAAPMPARRKMEGAGAGMAGKAGTGEMLPHG